MADDKKNLTSELNAFDCISRQAAMEDISKQQTYKMFEGEDTYLSTKGTKNLYE